MSEPIGGGEGYSDMVDRSEGDYYVSTASELESAIGSASGDDVVWIEGDAEINLNGVDTMGIRSGVTVASDRGQNGSQGALLYETEVQDAIDSLTPIQRDIQFVGHGDSRFTGIRLQGSVTEYFDHWDTSLDAGDIVASGIRSSGGLIDNCDISGWPTQSTVINRGAVLRANTITDNVWDGYGYGVMPQSGNQIIEYNYFNRNRHSIAGTGVEECAYVARYNHIGPDHVWIPLDMHPDGGRRISIHHNTVEITHYMDEISTSRGQQPGSEAYAITINGVPTDGCEIYNNWFHVPQDRRMYPRSAHDGVDTDAWFWNNHYGTTRPGSSDIGAPRDRWDLTRDIPQEALDARAAHPDDMLAEYDYINAATEGYDNRGGDLASLIEDANSNGQIVYCPSGDYEMDTGVSEYSGIVGVVGDGSGSTTIHYSGQSSNYLFNLDLSTFVLEGLTFQLDDYPGTGNTDVGLASAEMSNECWCDDVWFRGQREYNQDLGSGWTTVGGRFTFLIEMTSSDAISYLHDCHFPDGGTDRHEEIGNTVGHAIGPNADPSHVGTNVWHQCSCSGFCDNGFYVNNSPGRNVMWDCEAVNNTTGNFRLGNNDYLVGCYAEITDLPDGRLGQGVVANSGDNITIIGFEGYGSNDAYGTELIVTRSDVQSVTLDRCVGHVDGDRRVARLGSSDADVTVKNCYWYDEGNHSDSAIYQYGADVTGENMRVYSPNDELYFRSGSFSHNGTSYSTGTYQASEVGFEDPRPLPSFHFDSDTGGDSDPGTPDTANLAFYVEDSSTGDPIEDAEVIVRRED